MEEKLGLVAGLVTVADEGEALDLVLSHGREGKLSDGDSHGSPCSLPLWSSSMEAPSLRPQQFADLEGGGKLEEEGERAIRSGGDRGERKEAVPGGAAPSTRMNSHQSSATSLGQAVPTSLTKAALGRIKIQSTTWSGSEGAAAA
jgi:hypothetical protein